MLLGRRGVGRRSIVTFTVIEHIAAMSGLEKALFNLKVSLAVHRQLNTNIPVHIQTTQPPSRKGRQGRKNRTSEAQESPNPNTTSASNRKTVRYKQCPQSTAASPAPYPRRPHRCCCSPCTDRNHNAHGHWLDGTGRPGHGHGTEEYGLREDWRCDGEV